jgi:hypothetical protein
MSGPEGGCFLRKPAGPCRSNQFPEVQSATDTGVEVVYTLGHDIEAISTQQNATRNVT